MPAQFIGRREELELLARLLDESLGGQGRLVAISGDAGIGKTRLVGEVARLAADRGCRLLWSQMIEDPVAPPYFPWLLALRSGLQQIDDAMLRADLGSGASDVADIVLELRDRLGVPSSRPSADAAAARFQLFDSITRFLLALARRQPLVLLFDNLHLADRSSLALLEYICGQIATSATLIVIAYRASDMDASHPLRTTLARSARTVGFERLEMPGLNRTEIAQLLHAQFGRPAPPPLVDILAERSDGNPLYVCEVAAELERRATAGTSASVALDFKIPDSLRDVISGRLESLEQDALELLRTAAVLGRDFEVGLLGAVAHCDLDEVLAKLESARSAGIIVALDATHFRFRHALFREVLYEQHGRARRIALHGAAAAALEQRIGQGQDPAPAQLAYHFFETAQTAPDSKAITYCQRAAEDALARRAYGEAVVQLERALEVIDHATEPDPLLRFEVLTMLGDAQYRAGSVNPAAQTMLKPALLAHRLEWWDRLPPAVLEFQAMQGHLGLGHVAAVPLHRAALAHLPQDELALRARLLASLSLAYRYQPDIERAKSTLHESVRLARELGDPGVLLSCLQKAMWVLWESQDGARQEAMLREALVLAEQLGNASEVLHTMTGLAFPLLKLGRIEDLRALLPQFLERADAARVPHYRNVVAGFITAVAILEGRWTDAIRLANVSLRQAALQGTAGLEGRYGFQMFAIQRARGQLAMLAPLLKRITEFSEARLWLPGQILLHYELGQTDAARATLERLGPLSALPRDDLYEVSLVYLAEACSGLRDQARCRELATALKPRRSTNVCLPGTLALGSGARYLALLAIALRRHREARELFEEALEFNARLGAAPLLACTRLEFAPLLLQSDQPRDQIRAHELLALARASAKELDMRTLLVRIAELEASSPGADSLSERELAVLRLIAAGEGNKQIASLLFISQNTVATHVRNILRKTGARNRTEAVAHARQRGLIPTD